MITGDTSQKGGERSTARWYSGSLRRPYMYTMRCRTRTAGRASRTTGRRAEGVGHGERDEERGRRRQQDRDAADGVCRSMAFVIHANADHAHQTIPSTNAARRKPPGSCRRGSGSATCVTA